MNLPSDDFIDELAKLLWFYPDRYDAVMLFADSHMLAGSYTVLAIYYAQHRRRKQRARCIRWFIARGYKAKHAYWAHCHADEILAEFEARQHARIALRMASVNEPRLCFCRGV